MSKKPLDFKELQLIIREVHREIRSVTSRQGLLLETALQDERGAAVAAAGASEIQGPFGELLLRSMRDLIEEDLLRTRPTYNWGPQKRGETEYSPKWHLHASRDYAEQLREVSSPALEQQRHSRRDQRL